MANLGDKITKKLTTGRLLLKVTGETSYRDLGNVTEYKWDPKVTRKDHKKASGGFTRTDMSLASDINPAFTIMLDEHTPDLEQLRMLGTQQADTTQNAVGVAGEALTAASKQGRTYFAASMGLSAVVVKVGGIAQVLNVDYAVDLGSGAVTILNGGAIVDNSAVTIDYNCAQVKMHNFTAFQSLLLQGHIKLIEYDQFSVIPREITEFDGQIFVTNWGDNKQDYNVVTVDAVPLTDPTVQTRAD